MFVGALHFAMLQNEYRKATRRAISDALHSGQDELTALREVIFEIGAAAQSPVRLRVVPGFRVVGGQGAISGPAEQVALRAVPYVAGKLREQVIRQVLSEKFGKAKAGRLLKEIELRPLRAAPCEAALRRVAVGQLAGIGDVDSLEMHRLVLLRAVALDVGALLDLDAERRERALALEGRDRDGEPGAEFAPGAAEHADQHRGQVLLTE